MLVNVVAMLVVTMAVVIVVWMVIRFVSRTPFSWLWILALIQQAAMIYMWLPMRDWVAGFTYVLVVYFALETIAWLLGICDDSNPKRAWSVGPGDKASVVRLSHEGWLGRIGMAIMAASMAYMFLGMQIM